MPARVKLLDCNYRFDDKQRPKISTDPIEKTKQDHLFLSMDGLISDQEEANGHINSAFSYIYTSARPGA